MNVVQSFHYYIGAEGNNKNFINRSSGAYIFRPKELSARNFAYSGSYKIYKGIINRIYFKSTLFLMIYHKCNTPKIYFL